jgi:hypothetical protein
MHHGKQSFWKRVAKQSLGTRSKLPNVPLEHFRNAGHGPPLDNVIRIVLERQLLRLSE